MNQVGIQTQYMCIKNENRGNSEFFLRDLSEKLLYQWKTTTVAVCKCNDSIGGQGKTLSLMTSLSLNWRGMDLMDGPLDE